METVVMETSDERRRRAMKVGELAAGSVADTVM